jgi:two-component system sensor histidine kinase/response regulator
MTDLITPASNAGCLLVVDDQEANLQVLGSMLGLRGYEILPATDGAQALKRLAGRPPDLILLDLLMPGMNGFDVCRKIRENPEWAEIPIVFLSAADDKGLIVHALEAGGVDYITKPFNQTELIMRVQTHLGLKAARDRLKQLAEDKDELLGMITHYLQGGLAGMQMSAELLRDRHAARGDAKLRLMADNIRRSSSQMRAFVKALAANAAADHGISVKTERVNLGSSVTRALEAHRKAAETKQIAARAELPPGAVTVRADSSALDQALDNLVSNAIKFSPRGKELVLSVRNGGPYGECVVRDQGPGFTDDDKQRMFRRYARLSARPTGGEPSTGLGLSIVKKLVSAMGGELLCDSKPGQGAAFTLRLPAMAGNHPD